jgi:hypothetical protein
MKQSFIFTTSGQLYWHFHAIGVGVIFNYHVKSMQVITTHELSAQVIEVKDYYQEGGFETPEDFKNACMEIYDQMVCEDGITITLDYMDDPEIIESGEVTIGYDPKVIWN